MIVNLLKYKVIRRSSGEQDHDIYVDQDGSLFRVENGWGCEGGGGYSYEDTNPLDFDINIYFEQSEQ